MKQSQHCGSWKHRTAEHSFPVGSTSSESKVNLKRQRFCLLSDKPEWAGWAESLWEVEQCRISPWVLTLLRFPALNEMLNHVLGCMLRTCCNGAKEGFTPLLGGSLRWRPWWFPRLFLQKLKPSKDPSFLPKRGVQTRQINGPWKATPLKKALWPPASPSCLALQPETSRIFVY